MDWLKQLKAGDRLAHLSKRGFREVCEVVDRGCVIGQVEASGRVSHKQLFEWSEIPAYYKPI